MSNEHTESNQQQSHHDDRPRRRRNRKKRERTLRWYHDSNVGVDDLKANVVAKFFITTAQDETPSIRLVLMNRDTIVRPDGSIGYKPEYAGDIERNAIPLEILDLESLWNAMVSMKSRQGQMAAEFHGRPHEEAQLPKRSQQPARPLVHRMNIPNKVLAAASKPAPSPASTSSEPVVEDPHVDLAAALPGW